MTQTSRVTALALVLVLGLALALALAACSNASNDAPTTAPAAASSSPSSQASPRTSGSATVSEATAEPDPTSATQGQDPVAAAQRIWAAWTARDLAYSQWWAQLAPLLAPAARAAYAGTDPHNIPVLSVTGALALDPKAPDVVGYTARVHVPTNLGRFDLDLERNTASGPWLLESIGFPEGVH